MKNLFIDPIQHCPAIYFALKEISNVDYFSDFSRNQMNSKILWGYYDKLSFQDFYVFEAKCLKQDFSLLQVEYDNLFIVYSLSEMKTNIYSPENKLIIFNYYQELFNKLFKSTKINGKIFIIDNSDLCHDGSTILEKHNLQYSKILKKEFMPKYQKYSNNFLPFPYVVNGKNDALFILNSKKIESNEKKSDKCFWSGGIYNLHKEDLYQFVDRSLYLESQNDIIFNESFSGHSGVGSYAFVNRINEFKFWIYLKGAASLTRRFYEGLATDSLMLMQRLDVDFGMNDFISNECLFSSPEEFREKYFILKNDSELYKNCLEKQKEITNHFFYKEISKYIQNICK